MLSLICQSLYRTAALLFVAAVLAFTIPALSCAEEDLFPVFPEIQTNVDFWKNIYSRYDLSQAVIHDKHDLGIVYEVLNLSDSTSYRARKKNRRKIKRVKKRLRKVLLKLADKGGASNPEEQRILNLFGENPSLKKIKDASKTIRSQLGQKDRFRSGIVRSGAFIERIRKIFREEGVPSDLSYLAHVESSFNVNAYSKSGAAGIWQFTRSTGKQYLKIDYTVDERRDPIVASRAAARFLRDNYQQLGSWPLAITAYNHGFNGMTRAKKKHGSYQNIFKNYDGRGFGFASKNFYSEFIAAMDVADDHEKYFGELHLDNPWPFREVKLKGFAEVAKLADHLGLDLSMIRKYNPALRSPVFEGQKYIPRGYLLRLPSNSPKLAQLASEVPKNIFSSKQKRSQFYQVRRGDTAGVIARMHGVTINELVMANQLNRRATIYAGQNLRIPSLGNELIVLSKTYKSLAAPLATEKLTDVVMTAMLESPPEVKQPVPAALPVLPESPAIVAVLEVAEAEKEEAMQKERVHPDEPVRVGAEVVSENSIDGQNFLFGVQDLIYSRNNDHAIPALLIEQSLGDEFTEQKDNAGLFLLDINPQVVVGQLQIAKVFSKKGITYGVITVEAEETLGHYAKWLDLPTWRIRRQNRLRYGKAIMVGQEIQIPLREGVQDVFEEKRYEYHKELIEDFFAAYRVERIRKYTVKPGDNIWTLCRNEFDLPFWLVRQYNQSLKPSGLRPLQELLIPVVSRRQTDIAALAAKENVES